MRNFLFTAAAAATLVLGHVAPATSQDYDLANMQQGLNMLELNVSQIFAQYGIDADPRSLDLSQIAEIVSRVDSGDEPPSRAEIEFIVNRD